MKRIFNLIAIIALVALNFGAAGVTPAYAAGVVSTCNEASLLAALAGGGLVTFSCSGTITLTSTITIASDTTLDGAGQSVTISGGNAVRVFYVNSGVTFSLNAITVANGLATSSYGGGIYNNVGTLTVTNSTFSGNSASSGGGIYNEFGGTVTLTNSTLSGNSGNDGGGILNYGTLNVTNSTLSGNTADGGFMMGGAGGGIYTRYGALNVTNSTLSGNSATDYGGGIFHYGEGTVTMTNSTLSGNSAGYLGGGFYTDGSATLRNTIVANSPSGGNCSNQYATIVNGGNNIDSGTTCGFGSANGSMSSTDPLLGTLTGSPAYFPLNSGSPAIDGVTYNAPNSAPATDQRGVSRPQGTGYDIGAYEWVLPCSNAITVTSNAESGVGSLRQAITDVCAGGTITFDNSLSGQTITLTSGELAIDKNLTIDGSALASKITLSGNNASRVFNISNGITASLNSLIIANGYVMGDGGGIYNGDGATLNIMNSALSGNNAETYGMGGGTGGAISNQYGSGTVTITNSTLSGNIAETGGCFDSWGTVNVINSNLSGNSSTSYAGCIYNHYGATLTVINSTLSGNSTTYYHGGAIFNESGTGTITLTNSTLSGNSAPIGGGIGNYGGNATLRNTIITNSPSGGNCDGAITNGGNNIDSGTTCGFGSANGSLSSTDPLLGALTGSPAYFPLNSGSPAIDGVTYNAPNSAPATDQSGASRPQGAGYDIGAYEATPPTPLDDGGWVLVAHMSNSGGMFDGNGELMPGYDFGTFVANPLPSTPDFERAFPIVADKILFITGDGTVWGIADYNALRTLIDARTGVEWTPNLAFEIGINGIISNTMGNVLSRQYPEDPFISIEGNHHDGYNNQRMVWGEADYNGSSHVSLKNNHGGINVYVKAPTYTITYDGNGATGGIAPGDQTKTYGVDLILATNSGSLVKTGYAFTGWNTQADGLGTHYDAAGTYTANAAVTLYAEWTAIDYVVTYDAGLGSGSVPTDANNYNIGNTVTVLFTPLPTRIGYTFAGWSDGSTTYSSGGTESFVMGSDNVTLIAQWTALCSVTNNADSGVSSLRWAIVNCPSDGTITFDPSLSGQTITLTSGELAIDKNLTIDGSALASKITISGNNASRVFNISNGITASLNSLIIANGYVMGDGGGIYNGDGATLNITNSALSGNNAETDGMFGGTGGAISNQYGSGTVTITNSTLSGNIAETGGCFDSWGTVNVINSNLSGNSSTSYAGCIYNHYGATLTVINSTLSGNSTTYYHGGAIFNESGTGTITVTNSTLSGNSAPIGGGIGNYGGNATLRNTIITNSPSGGNCDGAITNGGNNIDDGTTCGFGSANGSMSSTDPQLGTLTGSPAYFPLNSGSPAIDAGDDATCAAAPVNNLDQRGATRPQGAHCDIGAYEAALYTVSYNANGATSGTAPASQTKAHDADLILATNSGSLVKTGYAFSGWNTQADGNGTNYAAGGTYTANAAVTLYAQWTALPNHTVTFNANGGVGSMSPQVSNVAVNLTLNAFTRTGYTFSGWNTLANGTGTAYANGAIYSFAANITLYAQWADTTAPNTTITAKPPVVTTSKNASFSFTSTEPGSTFKCKLDGGAYVNCSNLKAYSNLSASRHTFRVYAVDAAGNADATPATYTWSILTERALNGGFNTYSGTSKIPTNWVKNAGFAATDGKDATVKKEGLASVKITGEPGKTKTLTQTLNLSGATGDAFIFSFWERGSVIPAAGTCKAEVLLYQGTALKLTKTINCSAGTYSVFKTSTLSFNATSAYDKVVIRFTYSKASGTIWLDLASLMWSSSSPTP